MVAVRRVAEESLTGLCSHPQPPLVQTHTVTITAVSASSPSGISTTDVPIVPTKTIIYESSKVGAAALFARRRYQGSSTHEDRRLHADNKAARHWLKLKVPLTKNDYSVYIFFSSSSSLRWKLTGQLRTRTAQLCPAPRPLPQTPPAAPRSPPLTSQRSAVEACSVGIVSYLPLNYTYLTSHHQVVKSGSSETRVEKRIVITADSDVDQDKVQNSQNIKQRRAEY